MAVELKVPEMGESITHVQIGAWVKREGDWVDRDETVVELETDKTALELPSPIAGKLVKLLKKEGDKVAVGDVIAHLEESAKPAGATNTPVPPAAPASAPKSAAPAETRIMPAAQRELAQKNISPSEVTATGPGGRMLKEDVQRTSPPQRSTPAAPVHPTPSIPAGTEQIVPMTPIRLRIAERLVEAKQQAALLTTFNEVDMGPVQALRKEYKDAFEQKHGVKLGMMSFFVKACVNALELVPQVNAEIRGTDIAYRNFCDIGVAVGGGKGLVVPILRRAETMSFAGIERAIADFAKRAQENKLSLPDLQGGTFTISNGGIYGSLLSTPIVNPPQSAILGLHAIQDRPVARDGQVVIRPMMYLALTYDHRIIDGREAVTFLKRVKEVMESPARLLLEV